MQLIRKVARWWRLPFWALAIFTGSKSFVDNPILGSRKLNGAGLHEWRCRLAHRLAWSRRRRLAQLAAPDLRRQFDRDGYVKIPNFLPEAEFRRLQSTLLEAELEAREHRQGDTVTRRVPVGPKLLQSAPGLQKLLRGQQWRGIMAYTASTRSEPLYYIQTIIGQCHEGPPDPQVELHADTFHPSMKAWLFLTDVGDDDRPLTYVAGSHHLTAERSAWERRKSMTVLDQGDRLSQRGSFRISHEELKELKLPAPTRFAVPANTLVAIDTCGFHARASSDRPTVRVELWAYSRPSPFVPWMGFNMLSWRAISFRRAEWLASIIDWLSGRGWMVQHWTSVGKRRPGDVLPKTSG